MIIEQDGIKREVKPPFRLCIDFSEAHRLIELLERTFGRESPGLTSSAWVDVHPPIPLVPNRPPLPWSVPAARAPQRPRPIENSPWKDWP